MVHIVSRIESRERKPGKDGRKFVSAERFPQHPAPLYMIVAVEVTATYCIGRELEFSEDKEDDNDPNQKLNAAHCSF